MAPIRQTNFGGGELSPLLHGRTDLPLHQRALGRCRNFMVTREAAAVSRPGTLFIARTKYATRRCRLLPFVYADDVSYVLEVGHLYIRFFRNGAPVEASPGVLLEVATPYVEADLPGLRFAQTGLVLTLTHPSYAAKELRAPAWTFTDVQFGPPSDGLTGAPMMPIIVGSDGLTKAMPMLVDNPTDTLFVLDAQHPPREWRWLVTTLLQHKTDGRKAETRPVEISRFFDGTTPTSVKPLPADRMVVLYPAGQDIGGRGVLIRVPNFGAPVNPLPANWNVVGLCFYRGRGSLSVGGRASVYGLVGTTDRGGDFLDAGQEPDYLTPPPRGFSPFATGEHPVAVAFFQEKRVFGGSLARPSTLFASWTGDYGNHDQPALIIATQALEFELAARQREAIRHLVTMGHLMVLTDTAVWRFGGTAGEPLGPTSVEARVVDHVGSETVPPLLIDGSLLWVRNKGRGARALVPSGDGYSGVDISSHARHLFFGGEGWAVGTRQIRDWAYAEDPFGLVWAVRQDGALLSLAYSREHGMAAWARHDTKALDDASEAAAPFTAVCSVPEGAEDAVYVVVLRGSSWAIERMASRVENDAPTDGCCVDSAVRFEGVPTTVIDGLEHLEGRQVWFTSHGPNPPYGPYRVTGGAITLPEEPLPNTSAPGTQDDPWLIGYVGLRFVPELQTLDAFGSAEGRLRQKATTAIGFEVDNSRGLAVGQDFEHLEEWEQRAVGDGYQASEQASELVVMHVGSTYDKAARGCLRQTKPLPVTVVGLTREVDVGER